jgi:hypothetical protein
VQSLSPNAEVLIVAPHIEPPLREFRKLWGKIASASMLQTGLQLGRPHRHHVSDGAPRLAIPHGRRLFIATVIGWVCCEGLSGKARVASGSGFDARPVIEMIQRRTRRSRTRWRLPVGAAEWA